MTGRGRGLQQFDQDGNGSRLTLGRGRGIQMFLQDPEPGTPRDTAEDSVESMRRSFSSEPAQLRQSPSPPKEYATPPYVSTPQPTVIPSSVLSMGRGRGLLGAQMPTMISPVESAPVRQETPDNSSIGSADRRVTPNSSDVKSVTSLLARSTIDASPKASSVKSDTVHMTGTSGQPIDVSVNYIRLNFLKDYGSFQYHVHFNPEQDAAPVRYKLLKEHREALGKFTFDGTIMFCPKRLPNNEMQLKSVHPYSQETVTLKITFTKAQKLGDMKVLFNVLFHRIMKTLKMVEFKRQFYDPKACQSIPHYKLEIWPGYVTAVDEYEGGLMLCINPSHKVLRKQSVLDVIKDLSKNSPHNWVQLARATLINQCVVATYSNKNRTYRIDDIAFDQTPLSKFQYREEEMISYVDYFKNQYGAIVTDLKQPLLIHKKSERGADGVSVPAFVCLVPELCSMTGITDEMKTNFDLMKEMARYTRVTPNQRMRAVQQFIENVNSNPDARRILEEWGLVMEDRTIRMSARLLQPEAIIFGDNKRIPGSMDADWNRELTSSKCISTQSINNWALIFTKKDSRFSQTLSETLQHCAKPMGMTIRMPRMVALDSDRPDAYVDALKRVINDELDIVVCLCPTARDDRYSAIKLTCCVNNPIPSQVINSRTLANQKKLRSVVQKVALQMNCKLGGTLWAVNMPLKNVMMCGIDVYHGAGNKSCAAFVASSNGSMTKWYSRAVFHEPGQELIDNLKCVFVDAIHYYFENSGVFPGRIFVYRDGVGDGNLETVRCYETQQLLSCFPLVSENYAPSLTVVVVHKRINTRIFRVLNGEYDNPAPGTIVDHTVTRKLYYDFFIVSQKVRQGTVSPTHYIVVHDTSGLAPDQVQKLTYKMCHLYYNWPGTIRVPAPCQYAHKLAALVGQSIKKQPSITLSNKLFFL